MKATEGKSANSLKGSVRFHAHQLDKSRRMDDDEDMEQGDENCDENRIRRNWSNPVEFLLTCSSYVVGITNVWHFPLGCFRYGFLTYTFVYLIMIIIFGIPLVLFEFSLGQFTSQGPVKCFHFAPVSRGIGFSMIIHACILSTWFMIFASWSLYFLYVSLISQFTNNYNNNQCNTTMANCSNFVDQANLFDKIDFGTSVAPNWNLLVPLLLITALIFTLLSNTVKTLGKCSYVTNLLIYISLILLAIRSCTLPDSSHQIKTFIGNFNTNAFFMIDGNLWSTVTSNLVCCCLFSPLLNHYHAFPIQVFSLSCGNGGLITLASYNKFRNNGKLLR